MKFVIGNIDVDIHAHGTAWAVEFSTEKDCVKNDGVLAIDAKDLRDLAYAVEKARREMLPALKAYGVKEGDI